MKHTGCGPTQTTPAEMQSKFIAVEHRVKIKGHKQEEEYEYGVWDKARLIIIVFLFLFFLIIQKILATMSSPAD